MVRFIEDGGNSAPVQSVSRRSRRRKPDFSQPGRDGWERAKAAVGDGPLLDAMRKFERHARDEWPALDIQVFAAIALDAVRLGFGVEGQAQMVLERLRKRDDCNVSHSRS